MQNGPKITFEAETHTYRVDERIVRSVTQVLEDSGISDWSSVPADILWEAQQRGTMVHRACHFINHYSLDPTSVDERIGGYIEAFKAFRQDHRFRPRFSEHMVYRRITVHGGDSLYPVPEDLEIIGQLDSEGSTRVASEVVVDLKTGEPTDSWPPQLAAYVRGFKATARYTHKRLVVQLQRSGKYRLHWFPIRDFDRDWERFRIALLQGKRKELQTA